MKMSNVRMSILDVHNITIEPVRHDNFTVKRMKITDGSGSVFEITFFCDGDVKKLQFDNLPIKDERNNA
jgi:hypothetical protein|tara:strand:+ start:331 stop:537 length:207 start_codon:yes stop_codon:yes gene_type:complete